MKDKKIPLIIPDSKNIILISHLSSSSVEKKKRQEIKELHGRE